MVLRTVLGPAMDWPEETARNSNLLPVKAKGMVRLRSPASRGQLGQDAGAEFHEAALLGGGGRALFELLDDVVELVAQVDRDDGRRGFVGAEAVIVAGGGDGDAEQAGVLIDGADDGADEGEELGVLMRGASRG